MKLWLLTRNDVGYDEAEAFVVRAADESTARVLAAGEPGDEGSSVWLDGASCVLVSVRGEAEIIFRAFSAG